MPAGSPFADWKEARRFAGPLPFTFTYNEGTKEVLIIEGVRENWTPKPVRVLRRHTEPAIVRARRVSMVYPGTKQVSSGALPLADGVADMVCLLSAAHEIRSASEKVSFLKECRRLCKPGGKVVMVEHLRDFPNFLAFSVGFTHFFSRAAWRKAFKSAGFATFDETKFTPFMSIFECRP